MEWLGRKPLLQKQACAHKEGGGSSVRVAGSWKSSLRVHRMIRMFDYFRLWGQIVEASSFGNAHVDLLSTSEKDQQAFNNFLQA